MTDRLVELTLTEIKPDSADYKNRLTLSGEPIISGEPIKVGIQVPEEMFVADGILSPQGLAYVMTEIDLAIQRGYALRQADYDAIKSGEYFKRQKRKEGK